MKHRTIPENPSDQMIEEIAKAIHYSDGLADTVWPDRPDDDGDRGSSCYVRVCQDPELFRAAARNAYFAIWLAAQP